MRLCFSQVNVKTGFYLWMNHFIIYNCLALLVEMNEWDDISFLITNKPFCLRPH